MSDSKNRIMSLVNSGKLEHARKECLLACQKKAKDAELWFILSAICGQLQDFPAAEEYIKNAIEINPAVPTAYYNLAVSQKAQSKIDEAIASLEKSIQLEANFIASIYELGNIYLHKKDTKRAIGYYKSVILLSPDAFQAHSNIAIAYERDGAIESAISASLESLRIKPDQAEVVYRLGFIYDGQGDTDNAIQYYKKTIDLGAAETDTFVNLGRMYDSKSETKLAEDSYKKALVLDSNSIEALTNIALLYEKIRDTKRAFEYIEKANKIGSDDERFIYNRAKILASAQRYTESAELYEKVLENNPEFCEAAINLGNLHLHCGKAREAYDTYSLAYKINPDYYDARCNMLMSLNYTEQCTAIEIRDVHYSLAKEIESGVKQIQLTHISDEPRKLLRVGYVSADFRGHSVAYFLNDILKYSDKTKIENYCYSDVFNKDEVTRALKGYVEHWHDVYRLDDEVLAALIKEDAIDILIDLGGHTAGNRLAVFALKPAAIQITYLGYPNTTGLEAMDYRIVDKMTDPVGSEDMMSEVPLYLNPCFLSYTPPFKDDPKVTELPALEAGYVTFGSFNNLAKLSDEVITAWVKILHAVPNSKLCIKAKPFEDENIKEYYYKKFNDLDVLSSRLILLSSTKTTHEHLQAYNTIDIALDSFPYNGTTTTFEALWMGVPVICINGERHASRVSRSIVSALGLKELIAEDQDEYVSIACNLAANTKSLNDMRTNLRLNMRQSSLLDGKGFTNKFESLLLSLCSATTTVN